MYTCAWLVMLQCHKNPSLFVGFVLDFVEHKMSGEA